MAINLAKNDWGKTAIKFGKIGLEVIIFGLIAYFQDNNLYLVGIPLLEAILNALKHSQEDLVIEVVKEKKAK
jgi:hypothetical protein